MASGYASRHTVPDLLLRLSVTLALVAGTAASFLALLTWEVFRRSTFGRAMFVLTFIMSTFIIYHALLLSLGGGTTLLAIVESAVYTGFAIVVWSIAWTHPGSRRGGV